LSLCKKYFIKINVMKESKKEVKAIENEENLVIKELEVLSSINPKQAKKTKYLKVENQILNYDFPILLSDFENLLTLYFINCKLDDDSFSLGEIPSFRKLGFIRCKLTSERFSKLLWSIDPYSQPELLDLTGNKLGENP